tara:strand:- start:170351 stop:171388 length:1038 start_codon:yes stop_codon:yes gene_type:complete
MKKNNTITTAIAAMLTCFSFAQDIHFSGMDYSPQNLNPALAGANFDVQANINYRSQWNAVAAPFQTIGASADMRIPNSNQDANGNFAIGLNFFNDQAGEQSMSSNNVAINAAYHLKVNENSTIGLGMNTGFGQRSLAISGGQWGAQYDGEDFNPTLSSGEVFNNPTFSYFDVGAGALYRFSPEPKSRNNNGTVVNIGLAAYHVNRPNFSFIGVEEDPLYVRWSGFANARIGIGTTKMAVEPAVYAQFQGPNMELLLGTDYRFFLSQETSAAGQPGGTSLALGLFYRNQDALISRFSVRFGQFDAGMAYDFNLFSSLREVSSARGGVEVFLRWVMSNAFDSSRARI